MNLLILLSLITFVGVIIISLLIFGITWEIFITSVIASAIFSIIYYKVIKYIFRDIPED